MAIDEKFMGALKDYIQTSKDKGLSPVAINKGVEFVYGMYLQNKQAEADQAERDRIYGMDQRKMDILEAQEARAAGKEDRRGPNEVIEVNGQTYEWDEEIGDYVPFGFTDPDADLRSGLTEGDTQGDQIDLTQPTAPGTGFSQSTMKEGQDFTFGQPEAGKPPEQQRLEQASQYFGQEGLIGTIPRIAKEAVKGLWQFGKGAVKSMAEQERQKTALVMGDKPRFGTTPWWSQPQGQ